MGDIIEKRRRYYSGLNADKVSIPAGGKAAGDRYYATDTLVEFTWTGAAWVPLGDDTVDAGMLKTDAVETLKIKNLNVTLAKASLGFGRFVARPLAAWDWTQAAFTLDGAWHSDGAGLDCSGIVPAGTVAIVFLGSLTDDAVTTRFRIRQSAANSIEILLLETLVANKGGPNIFSVVPCDADRFVDYHGIAGTDTIRLGIIGYFI